MIDYHTLRNWHFPVIEHHYTVDDTMRYALTLGFGEDPTDARQLKFVNDVQSGTPVALPTMAVILGFPGSWMQDPATGIDFKKIVHGEETLVLHQPLPASGTVIAHHRVVHITDKGPGRGATITYDKDLVDKVTGQRLATITHTTFARGNGGFSEADGRHDDAAPAPRPVPQRAPDRVCDIATLPQQALLYRLSADRNPLHSDPDAARAAGFDRPILHGLCSYGIAGRALVAHWCGHDPARLTRLFTRFSAPVYPGEMLRFEMYRESDAILFRATVPQRQVTVLDCGLAEITS
jgi:acyl dehydratase